MSALDDVVRFAKQENFVQAIRAAAELAELRAALDKKTKLADGYYNYVQYLGHALDEARKAIEPFAKAWKENLTIEEAVTLDDLYEAAAWLEKYPVETITPRDDAANRINEYIIKAASLKKRPAA